MACRHFLWPALNLVILIAVLVYFARKPLQAYFEKRRSEIQGELQSAADQLATAESTYAKWQRRMIDLEGELDEIRATSRQRAEAERERIIQDARATAERIRAMQPPPSNLELRRAREILREEATQLAIELAGERLSREVTEADRDRLIDEFIGLIASTTRLRRKPAGGRLAVQSKAAHRYARALFSLAQEEGGVASIRGELDDMARLLAANPDLRRRLFQPLHPASERRQVLKSVCEQGHGSQTIRNFFAYSDRTTTPGRVRRHSRRVQSPGR